MELSKNISVASFFKFKLVLHYRFKLFALVRLLHNVKKFGYVSEGLFPLDSLTL